MFRVYIELAIVFLGALLLVARGDLNLNQVDSPPAQLDATPAVPYCLSNRGSDTILPNMPVGPASDPPKHMAIPLSKLRHTRTRTLSPKSAASVPDLPTRAAQPPRPLRRSKACQSQKCQNVKRLPQEPWPSITTAAATTPRGGSA